VVPNSSVTNFHSFLFKPDKDRFLNRHAMVNGCEVKPGDHICHALNNMIDEDIGGSLKPLESIKGHLNYLFFSFVHVGWFWFCQPSAADEINLHQSSRIFKKKFQQNQESLCLCGFPGQDFLINSSRILDPAHQFLMIHPGIRPGFP
jgi:hypothetical protein